MCSELRTAIFERSIEKIDWNRASAEWSSGTRWTEEDWERCVCGEHIKERCEIIHRITHESLIIGNRCINQFHDVLPLCEYCEVNCVPTIVSRYCVRCRVPSARPDRTIHHGYFVGKTFRDAYDENPAFCKWELQNGLSTKNPQFTAFLESRAALSIAFRNTEAIEPPRPPPPPPPPPPRPPPPPPDYSKLLRGNILSFGKHKGKTFRQVLREDPDYCLWVVGTDTMWGTDIHTYLVSMMKK